MFEVGTGKADITAFRDGIGMMGYGRAHNTLHGIETRLYARAFVFKDPDSGRKVAFVNAEMCFVTTAVKTAVLRKLSRDHGELGFKEETLFLTAQHTHSAPGGYSHYGFYNLSIPGFVRSVFQTIVNGFVDSIVSACQSFRPAKLSLTKGMFAPDKEVAFNRSVKAYNANPEVKKLSKEEAHLALDRNMDLLRIESPDGEPIGMINWFGVHTTSLPNFNTDINADNKGYASQYTEVEFHQQTGNTDFLAAFAQGSAGDVSPNWIWDWKTFRTRGKYKNNLESARFNGRLQFEHAEDLWKGEDRHELDTSRGIDYALMHFDFSDTVCDPEFTAGKEGMLTTPSCIGVEMLEGTSEGPGMPKPVGYMAKGISNFMMLYEYAITYLFRSEEDFKAMKRKYRFQGKKHIAIETGNRKIFGTHNVKRLVIPGFVDGGIKTFKAHHRSGGLDDHPWSAQKLPLHLFRLGELCLVGIPAEVTTVAAMRLRQTMEKYLADAGVTKVILAPYANAYSGYITTHEEYQHQLYEGGHTVFGEWTLAAFQTHYKTIAQELCKHEESRAPKSEIRSAVIPEEHLRRRSFEDGMEMQPRRAKRKQRAWKANTKMPVGGKK